MSDVRNYVFKPKARGHSQQGIGRDTFRDIGAGVSDIFAGFGDFTKAAGAARVTSEDI